MIRPIVLAALALSLSGCALLSSPDPVQLYRFGDNGQTAAALAAEPIQIKLRDVELSQATRGDRILGVTGVEAAFIKGARWVSPASDLYAQSLQGAFAAQSTSVRLIGQRELTPTTRLLDVDVRAFEARYDYEGAVPVVTIVAQARLLRSPERTVVAEQIFTVNQPAGENRVSVIAQAFDLATRDLNSQIVRWTEANARD